MSEEDKGVEIPNEDGANWEPSNGEERRAASQGWKPEDLYDGEPDTWVDARTFNVKGELMGRIQGMGRKLGVYEKEIAQLKERQKQHHNVTKQMVEASYKKAMADIKRERRDAIEMGDYDRMEDLDDRKEELETKQRELDSIDDAPEPETVVQTPDGGQRDISSLSPVERAFVDVVNSDPALRSDEAKVKDLSVYADSLWANRPDITVLEFNRELDKYLNPPRDRAPGPSARGEQRVQQRKSRYTKNDLTDMELDFAKTFKETGAFSTIQEYIDDAAANGVLEIQQR
jgi:hypothetical protein